MNGTPAARFGLAVALVGCVAAVYGLGVYQAWWTIAFAIGGVAVGFWAQRDDAILRPLVAGISFVGALLLVGVGLFLLYGWMVGPARPCPECADTRWQWLAASAASIVVAMTFVAFSRLLLRRRATPE
jgi:hypothetical protein